MSQGMWQQPQFTYVLSKEPYESDSKAHLARTEHGRKMELLGRAMPCGVYRLLLGLQHKKMAASLIFRAGKRVAWSTLLERLY